MNETSQGRICVMTNDMFGCDDKWGGEFKYFAVTHGQMSNGVLLGLSPASF